MLLVNKKEIHRELYITQLNSKAASLIFKARCRMLNLRNNFKSTGPLSCEKCNAPIEDEKHIFSVCPALSDVRNKFNINAFSELFQQETSIERFVEISEFLTEVSILFGRNFTAYC